MAVENYINNYTVLVGANINNSSTSLTVSAAASIASGFRILVGSELMLVTAGGTTTTWTVTRGIESTAAVSHNTNDSIYIVLTSTALDNIRTQISGIGTYANLPASGMKSGDQWKDTDGPYNHIYDGSNWQAFYSGYNVTIPPSSSWTWVNQGTSTATTVGGALSMQWQTLGAVDNTRGYVQNLPGGGTYTMIAGFENYTGSAGIMLYDGTKATTYYVTNANYATDDRLFGFNWTNSTTFSSRVFSDIIVGAPAKLFLKVRDNATTEKFYISSDATNWVEVSSRSSGTFLTATKAGITGGDLANTNGVPFVGFLCFHFSLTT